MGDAFVMVEAGVVSMDGVFVHFEDEGQDLTLVHPGFENGVGQPWEEAVFLWLEPDDRTCWPLVDAERDV